MNDMSGAITPKSDQLNSDDLISGPRTITVREVAIKGGQEQPVAIFFNGDNGKPFKPCKSVSRLLVAGWGADANKYVGRSLTLYRDPKVTWAGMEVGGIRVSEMSDIERPLSLALTQTKGKKAITVVQPLKVEKRPPADPDAGMSWEDRADRLRAHLETIKGDDAKAAINHAMSQTWWKAMKAENAPLAQTLRDMAAARIRGAPISAPPDEPIIDRATVDTVTE